MQPDTRVSGPGGHYGGHDDPSHDPTRTRRVFTVRQQRFTVRQPLLNLIRLDPNRTPPSRRGRDSGSEPSRPVTPLQ